MATIRHTGAPKRIFSKEAGSVRMRTISLIIAASLATTATLATAEANDPVDESEPVACKADMQLAHPFAIASEAARSKTGTSRAVMAVKLDVETLLPGFFDQPLQFDESKATGHHWCAPKRIAVPINDQVTITVDYVEAFVRQHADGLVNWLGRVGGSKSGGMQMVIDEAGTIIEGSVSVDGQRYRLSPSKDDPTITDIVSLEGEDDVEVDGGGIEVPVPAKPEKSEAGAKSAGITIVPLHFSSFSSATAQAKANSILNEMDLALFLTGVSGVSYSFGTGSVRLYHIDDFGADLNDVFSDVASDSVVAALRNQYGGDLVIALTDKAGGCPMAPNCIGQAHNYNGFPNAYLSAVDADHAFFDLAGVHELGHNIGANHEGTGAPTQAAQDAGDRTVMWSSVGFTTVTEFSSDDVGGIGSSSENNESVFEGTHPATMAGFKTASTQPAPTPSGVQVFAECGSVVDVLWTPSGNAYTHHTLEYSTTSNFLASSSWTINLGGASGAAKVIVPESGSIYFRLRGDLGPGYVSSWIEATNDPLSLPVKKCV